jgi:hypothetical protein
MTDPADNDFCADDGAHKGAGVLQITPAQLVELIQASSRQSSFECEEFKSRLPIDPPKSAKSLFMMIADTVRSYARKADLSDPSEFHAILWLLVKLSGEGQQALAEDQGVTISQMNRWVKANATPETRQRRQAIIDSALFVFAKAIEQKVPQPLAPFERRTRFVDGRAPAHSD